MNELNSEKIDQLLKGISPDAQRIDLKNLTADEALALLDAEFTTSANNSAFIIDIPAAVAGKGQTVFQPVGRYLLSKKKSGELTSCIPLTSGIGFYVELG